MDTEQIAELCHETNRVYCRLIGDNSQRSWADAEEWQKLSAARGVLFRIENPDAPASAQHKAWLKDKTADGWKYGPVKDPEKKEHPCCVPYNELPQQERRKDALFGAVVDTCLGQE